MCLFDLRWFLSLLFTRVCCFVGACLFGFLLCCVIDLICFECFGLIVLGLWIGVGLLFWINLKSAWVYLLICLLVCWLLGF